MVRKTQIFKAGNFYNKNKKSQITKIYDFIKILLKSGQSCLFFIFLYDKACIMTTKPESIG